MSHAVVLLLLYPLLPGQRPVALPITADLRLASETNEPAIPEYGRMDLRTPVAAPVRLIASAHNRGRGVAPNAGLEALIADRGSLLELLRPVRHL